MEKTPPHKELPTSWPEPEGLVILEATQPDMRVVEAARRNSRLITTAVTQTVG
jgi:hypothetical protein